MRNIIENIYLWFRIQILKWLYNRSLRKYYRLLNEFNDQWGGEVDSMNDIRHTKYDGRAMIHDGRKTRDERRETRDER